MDYKMAFGRLKARAAVIRCSGSSGIVRPSDEPVQENVPVPVAAPKAAKTTITPKQIAADIAARHGLTKEQVEAVLNDLVTEAIRHLRNGDGVRLTGLGTLYAPQDRPPQTGLNLSTGEIIEIKGTKKLAFRPAKGMNDSLNDSQLTGRIIPPAAVDHR